MSRDRAQLCHFLVLSLTGRVCWQVGVFVQDVGAPDAFCSQLWAFATLGQQEKSCCMRAHSRTRTHTRAAVQPSPILVDLKGQRPTAGGTVFQRTVLGEFLKSLLLDFSKKSVGGGAVCEIHPKRAGGHSLIWKRIV